MAEEKDSVDEIAMGNLLTAVVAKADDYNRALVQRAQHRSCTTPGCMGTVNMGKAAAFAMRDLVDAMQEAIPIALRLRDARLTEAEAESLMIERATTNGSNAVN